MSFSVAGKTAIVTGAANGVGLAIARHLADAGANVMFADKDETRLRDEVGEVTDETSNIRYFAGDLREKLTIANLLSATLDAFDQVNILVNAARQVTTTSPLDPDDESMTVMLDQNLLSSLKLSQLVARRMIKQGKGSEKACIGTIVNLSSIAAQRTQSELMAFSVSCAALDQMTRSLAVSLAPERVRVNAVAFGGFSGRETERFKEKYSKMLPIKRMLEPEEAGPPVEFLLDDAKSSSITGHVLVADGGWTIT